VTRWSEPTKSIVESTMSGTTPRQGPGGLDGGAAIRAVHAGDVTTAEVYEDAVRRVEAWEPELGAVVERIQYRPPYVGPLEGMMLGIKTHIDVAGQRNWRGLQAQGLEARPVHRDATVVARLRDAGATLVCTTAAPYIGVPGGVTPQTRNARSLDRVSGGSSGGSASAIAAGLVHGALGSDSGGSIRIPAACCGVVGLQTTRGLVPLTGAGGLTYSMDNVGPMAESVGDVRSILGVIAGFDPKDPYSVAVDSFDRWDGGPLRIGLPIELVDWNIDAEVAETFDRVLELMRNAGHHVESVSLPILRESMELGPRTIGLVESGAIIEDSLLDVLGDVPELVEAVKRSKEYSGPTMARTYHRVAVLRSELRGLFTGYDLLMTPTLPCRIPHGSAAHLEAEIEVGGVVETRTTALTRLVNPWNLAAVPAGSQPVGSDSGGGPISVQIIGSPFSDWKLLDVMEFLEASLGGPWDTVAPPG
jgi:aspartyl-tRNA(Asn)/glutamyl-tRNA(Gln) amidotransferase subunit A